MLLNKLCIGYKSKQGKSAPMVKDIDAELRPGEFVCLVGRNGCGKSTLLKTIAGLINPLSGTIESTSPSDIGIVLTEIPRLRNTTVFELVSYGRLPHLNLFAKLRQEDIDAVNNAIETVGIAALKDRKTCELSDGERQKTMIARALAQGSDILLLDEPSAFLDYPSKHELMQLLSFLAHNEQKSIILSTHDLDLVKQYADKVWEISNSILKEKVGITMQ